MLGGMIRVVATGLLFVGAGVSAQPNVNLCRPFAPAAPEVEEILQLIGSEVPESAQLESACFTTVLRRTGAIELSEVRRNTYTFSWATDEVVAGVRFYQKARCTVAEAVAPSCPAAGRFAEWNGALTSFETDITSYELVELLRATQDTLPQALAIQQVERTYVSDGGQRFLGVRRYNVVTVEARGKYLYTFERTCTAASDCVWGVTPRGSYRDPVY